MSTPGYYAYAGYALLGNEPLGSRDKLIRHDLKTDLGALRAAKRVFGDQPFKLFHFSNFYDERTFREIRF